MVKRYEHDEKCGGEYDCRMYECSTGDYVDYADYEKAINSHEKLVKHIEALKSVCETYIPTDQMDEANSTVILLCMGDVEEIGQKLISKQALKAEKPK